MPGKEDKSWLPCRTISVHYIYIRDIRDVVVSVLTSPSCFIFRWAHLWVGCFYIACGHLSFIPATLSYLMNTEPENPCGPNRFSFFDSLQLYHDSLQQRQWIILMHDNLLYIILPARLLMLVLNTFCPWVVFADAMSSIHSPGPYIALP